MSHIESCVSMPQIDDQPPSQRKQATVLFADLSGFTAMSEKLDPEQVRDIVNRYLAALTVVVQRYEGTIDKYIGDCVMAVFGVPRTHQNDPERACRAAVEMQKAVRDLNTSSSADIPNPPELHVGINTGLVVAAPIGGADTSQFTVMGDAVNLASRLCHEAEAGEIAVGESTWEQVKGLFEFGPRDLRSVKGKSQKTPVYFLHDLLQARPAMSKRPRTRMVGREREMGLAEALLDDAQVRRGALLYITGEAGIGKSRMVEEVAHQAELRSSRVLSSTAQPFEAIEPYGMWRQVLERLVGVVPGTDPGRVQLALEQFLLTNRQLAQHTSPLRATFGLGTPEFETLDEIARFNLISTAWKSLLNFLQSTSRCS